jgi:hypothetical protein
VRTSFNGGNEGGVDKVSFPLQRRWPWRQRGASNGGGSTCSTRLEVEEASWAKKAEWAGYFRGKKTGKMGGPAMVVGPNAKKE